MKIQITFNEPQIDGYVWASPFNEKLKDKFYQCWEYCMESQCLDFYGPSVLNLFTTKEIEKIVPMWAKLISPGGRFLLGGIDFYMLAKYGQRRDEDLGSINDHLFGRGYALKSLTSIESTRKFLENLNFKINDVKIDSRSFEYTIEGIKND